MRHANRLPAGWNVGAALIVLVLAVGWWLGHGCRHGIPEVDFHEVFIEEDLLDEELGDPRPVLRVAVASMISPEYTKEYYEDLLRLIGSRVGRRTVFVQRPTYAEVDDLLERRELDLAFVCAGPYVAERDRFNAEIIAVPVVRGERTYCAYIIANRNSTIESLDDLKGRRFAFTDLRSNTGYLVPNYLLLQRGYTSGSFFGETFFTYSHDNSIRAVAQGLADGAAVDQLVWDFMDAVDPTYTVRTKIIERSDSYGIPPVVAHPELDEDLKSRLREVFLSLHEDTTSGLLLRQLRIDRFENGDDTMYDSVRQMQQSLVESAKEGQ